MAAKQDTERPLLNKNEAKRTEWNWGEAVNTQHPPPVMYFLQSRLDILNLLKSTTNWEAKCSNTGTHRGHFPFNPSLRAIVCIVLLNPQHNNLVSRGLR